MAIVVEQRKSGGGIISLLIWLVILIVIGAGFYYVFFKKPEIIPITPTAANMRTTEEVAKIKLNPDEVIGKIQPPSFEAYILPAPAETKGKANPFLGF